MLRQTRFVALLAFLFVVVLTYRSTTAAGETAHSSGETAIPQSGLTVSKDASPAEQRATLAMWTREAISAAQSMPMPEAIAQPAGEEATAPETGRAVIGGLPDPTSLAAAQAEFPEEWQLLAAVTEELIHSEMLEPEGTAGVYTSYRANYYSQMHTYYPYAAVGRLTFTTPNGNSSCSATVISPYNIVVTAAHCAYNTVSNQWYSNWAFSPAWRNGSSPYGVFPWTSARVLNGWINASGVVQRYDVALIKLGNNSASRPVTYYTGYLGRSWDYGYTQSLHAAGYPSNLNSGLYTYICAAETFSGGTDVLGMGCNMTYGSSGGPWIRVFTPYAGGSVNYVNAVVSGGTPGTNTFYGPRFSSSNIVPLCTQGTWTC
jgi:V8-like Glu-specific endopeptidase